MSTASISAGSRHTRRNIFQPLHIGILIGVFLAAGAAWFLLSRPSFAKATQLLENGRTERAVVMLTSLASGGDARAAALLGDLYWRGGAVSMDRKKAVAYLEQAARAGDVQANAPGLALLRKW